MLKGLLAVVLWRKMAGTSEHFVTRHDYAPVTLDVPQHMLQAVCIDMDVNETFLCSVHILRCA